MKRIALGIAAAILGVSGVAGATMGVNEIVNSNHETKVSAQAEKLALNCWAVSGASNNASCSTAGPGAADVANLVDGIDLPDTSGLLATAADLASVAGATVPGVNDVTGLLSTIPSACSTSLPVGVPVPFGAVTSAGLGLAQSVDAFVKGLPVPVSVPNLGLPVDAADILSTVNAEAGCLGAQGGSLPVAAPCSANVPGLPVAVPEPVAGIVGTVTGAVNSVTGGVLSTNANNTAGVKCETVLPKAGVPSVPGLPKLPVPTAIPNLPLPSGVGSVQGTVDTVTGLVNGVTGGALNPVTAPLGGVLAPVTGTVNGLVNGLPVGVPSLPLPVINCSASAGASSGGLLGSLTGLVSGTCN